MKKFSKITAAVLAVVMISLLIPVFAVSVSADLAELPAPATEYASGDGAENSPYVISNLQQLVLFASDAVNSKGKFFKLGADIDLSGYNWLPVTPSKTGFGGTFDGDGHTISGLYVETESDYAGFFGGCLDATIKNLTVSGPYVCGPQYTGPIVGWGKNVQLLNCSTEVEVVKGSQCGGLGGRVEGENLIVKCISKSNVVVEKWFAKENRALYIGGLFGTCGGSDVYYCASLGDVTCSINLTEQPTTSGTLTGDVTIGGLIGIVGASSAASSIKFCYSTSNISALDGLTSKADSSFCGGLFGRIGQVANCVARGCFFAGSINWANAISGEKVTAGTVGAITGHVKNASTLSNCYYSIDGLEVIGLDSANTEIETVYKIDDADMKGPDAVKNMNIGSSVSAIVDPAIDNALLNTEYWEYQIAAFKKYTGGVETREYLKNYVYETLNISGASVDAWRTAAGLYPEIAGDVDALLSIVKIADSAVTIINNKLAELAAQYDADPEFTTVTEAETDEPAPAETSKQIIIVVGTTAGPSDTKKPADTTTTAPADNKDNSNGCGTFTAAAGFAAVMIAAIGAAIVIKKH